MAGSLHVEQDDEGRSEGGGSGIDLLAGPDYVTLIGPASLARAAPQRSDVRLPVTPESASTRFDAASFRGHTQVPSRPDPDGHRLECLSFEEVQELLAGEAGERLVGPE